MRSGHCLVGTLFIAAGVLNDVAWSRTTKLLQKISGLLDPRVGRGLYNSFPPKYPLIRFPLDHAFHSRFFRLVELRRLPHIGSDHFPIDVGLSYEKTAELTWEEPAATAEEHEEAHEIIKNHRMRSRPTAREREMRRLRNLNSGEVHVFGFSGQKRILSSG